MGFLDKLNFLVKGGTERHNRGTAESSTANADVLGPRILHSVDNPTVEFAASFFPVDDRRPLIGATAFYFFTA